jgi:hypothetical protein
MAKTDTSSVKKTRNWTLAQKLAHYVRRGRQVPGVEGRCLEWIGATNEDGYGDLCYEGKRQRVHRLTWVHHNGPLTPERPHVLHRCDVPNCIRRKHLWDGTHADNMKDRAKKNRGNTRGQRNGRAKLTDAQVLMIREECGPQLVLAKRYGVGQSTISRIKLYLRKTGGA